MKKIVYILLVLTIILSFLIRTFQLSDRPIGFTWDEAALGYNAYSLLQTGKDEHGIPLPIIFKSFGDYKPGLYIYLSVPLISLFGLNEMSTRLASAIMGTVSVAGVFLLSRSLRLSTKTSLFASIALAVMPWAIHFSRGAWESNCAVALTVLGSTLFLRKKYFVSAVLFGLTFWMYQNAKVFTPVILLTLLTLDIKSIYLKRMVLPALVLIFMLFPVLINIANESGRLKVYSVFSYTRSDSVLNKIANEDNISPSDVRFQLFHAEKIDQFRGIIQRFTNAFSSRFLFKEGDWSNARNSTIYYGNLHIVDVVPIVIGMWVLITKSGKSFKFLAVWLLAAPIGAAFSRDIVSGVRALPMIIPLAIIIGVGLEKLFTKKIAFGIYTVSIFYFMFIFMDLYILHMPLFTAQEWLYPYRSAIKQVVKNESKYNNIVITDKLGQPYIFLLFYGQIAPDKYQSSHDYIANKTGDVGRVTSFDKYEFRPVFWPRDRGSVSTMFVGDQFELPEEDLQSTNNIERVAEIVDLNGQSSLRIVALP